MVKTELCVTIKIVVSFTRSFVAAALFRSYRPHEPFIVSKGLGEKEHSLDRAATRALTEIEV